MSARHDQELADVLETSRWRRKAKNPHVYSHPSYKRVVKTFNQFTGLSPGELETHARCIVETIIRADEQRAKEASAA